LTNRHTRRHGLSYGLGTPVATCALPLGVFYLLTFFAHSVVNHTLSCEA